MGKLRKRGMTYLMTGIEVDAGKALAGGQELATTTQYGRTLYVDASKAASGDGRSWAGAFKTMAEAFAALAGGERVFFRGNVREQLTSPTGVPDVTIIGAGNRPRHADTHPLNGEKSASTWKLPASGSTNNPLLILRNPGWRIFNVLFAAHASNYALRLERTGVEDETEQDASHLEVMGCRFASGGGGISDVGGCFNVKIEGNHFGALTVACILGVGNIGVG